MSLQDIDYLGDLIEDFEDMIYAFKNNVGAIMQRTLDEIFASQGPPTISSDDLNPSVVNPEWPPLSPITVQLKGSTAILMDLGLLRATVAWEIEPHSEIDGLPDVLVFGWFRGSADRAYIAAIHEFGLTGQIFNTPTGIQMGGQPIGRTQEARRRIQWWFRTRVGLNVSGRVVIPRRSMLGKTADILNPMLEDLFAQTFNAWLENIRGL